MATKVRTEIANFGHELLVLALVKSRDYGQDLKRDLGITRASITNGYFVQTAKVHLNTIEHIYGYTKETIEQLYQVTFCKILLKNVEGTEKLYFKEQPRWGKNVIYYSSHLREIYYIRLEPSYILKQMSNGGPNLPLSHKLLKFNNINDFSTFSGYQIPTTDFTIRNIPEFRTSFKRDIHFYHSENDYVFPYYKPAIRKFPSIRPAEFFLDSTESRSIDDTIGDVLLITNPHFITKLYICNVVQGCKYTTSKFKDFSNHTAICELISVQRIHGEIKAYGKEGYMMDEIINSGYLPSEAKLFRKKFFTAFDIETFENVTACYTTAQTEIKAHHRLLSIAVGSNTGLEKCWIRENDSNDAVVLLVKHFVSYLEEMFEVHLMSMPSYFHDAVDLLHEDVMDFKIPKTTRMRLSSMKFFLEQYLKMDIFGFNSGNNLKIYK